MSKMSLNHVAEGQTVRVDELLATGSIRRCWISGWWKAQTCPACRKARRAIRWRI